MVEGPLITIITPTYNQGRFFKDCLDSVRNQTYKRIEHLVFDAKSTDETAEVISSYLGTYNLQYVCEADAGQSDAINKGLDRAKGEIVCWLNSDDLFFDDRVLERIVSIFNSNPKFDVIAGDGYYVDETNCLLTPIIIRSKYLTAEHFKTGDYLLQPSTFWRRNSVRMDTDLHYAFDWKYFNGLFGQGYRYYHCREYLSCYRIHGASKTHMDSAKRKKEILVVLRQNQASAACIAWARVVVASYSAAESTGFGSIKKLTRVANLWMHRLSNGRIHSC